MLTKNLLRFPELLLLLSLLVAPFFCSVSFLDIHFNDTYYVFDTGTVSWTSIYLPFFIPLFASWVFHVQLRRNGSTVSVGRILQALASVVCFGIVILSISYPDFFYKMPRRYFDSTHYAFPKYRPLSQAGVIAAVIFVLLQLLFWISASVILLKRRKQKKDQLQTP